MRRIAWWGMVLLGAATMLGACAGTKDARAPAEEAERSATGVLTHVRQDSIAVRAAEGAPEELRLARTGETELVRGGEPVAWQEVTEGTPVRVYYQADRATRVEVLTGAEADEVRDQAGFGPEETPPPGAPPGAEEPPPGAWE